MDDQTSSRAQNTELVIDRRALLVGGLAAAGIAASGIVRNIFRKRASVFIARNQEYGASLERTIQDGLLATGLHPELVRGKRVLLKPNLVEPSREWRHMTTHPAMVAAASQVFRRWGARVVIGEAPGHVRDTELALVESGFSDVLESLELPFVDLNYGELKWVENRGRASILPGFYFAREVAEADLVVSMPKMKTHHWVGVTASMKNLYGVIPGIKYGWPKNVLHFNGISETVFDINASLTNTLAIVDGIDCMEGDGPIMGSLKQMGLVVIGGSLTAVDATVCRLMDINPVRVNYLNFAGDRLGPIDEHLIEQRGEPWQPLVSPFAILDRPHLRDLRDHPGPIVS